MAAKPPPSETQVLVIGGGPVGLTLSGLLSHLGIANAVIERRAEAQGAPAAHVVRKRSMEVFRTLGVEEDVLRVTPDMSLDYITWCTTLGGSEAGRLDVRPAEGRDGVETWTNCSQNLLEPILLEHAQRQPGATVHMGTECTAIEGDGNAVAATIRCTDGEEHRTRANWAIACDGAGSPTRRALDIPMVGQGALGNFFMIHFEADLTPWIQGRQGPLFWIMHPQATGSLIIHDPKRSIVFMTPVQGQPDEESTLAERLQAALGVSTPTRIVDVKTWAPHVQVAEHYRKGRIFLAGDAAHRFPPSGGLGLNTGVQDVYNLAWKLALVEKNTASTTLLDTYESECRPAAQTNADDSFANLVRLGEVFEPIGPCADLDALEQRLSSMNSADRERLATAIEEQRSHFTSDGRFPEDTGAPEDGSLRRWPSGYDGFTLYSSREDRNVVDDLSRRIGVQVHSAPLPATCPAPPAAFLTRPDGVVAWSTSDTETDYTESLTHAILAVLHPNRCDNTTTMEAS